MSDIKDFLEKDNEIARLREKVKALEQESSNNYNAANGYMNLLDKEKEKLIHAEKIIISKDIALSTMITRAEIMGWPHVQSYPANQDAIKRAREAFLLE